MGGGLDILDNEIVFQKFIRLAKRCDTPEKREAFCNSYINKFVNPAKDNIRGAIKPLIHSVEVSRLDTSDSYYTCRGIQDTLKNSMIDTLWNDNFITFECCENMDRNTLITRSSLIVQKPPICQSLHDALSRYLK